MAERYDFYVHDNRKITFNLTEPIMREDSGVTDFVFHIPKILNELEVSDWQWWLVFVNAKKEKYSIALILSDDPESPLEKNVATYTVDYAMSIKAGSVQFALEAINTGTGGAIDNEWHTLTYETKVKETLQGNQAEYAETESDIISALLEEVRTKMNQVIGGATPTPVASVSAMTDPSKLYLLTTDGHWYYHNGTQFVSGGVYGAGEVDSVPTQGSTNAVSSGGVYSALEDKADKDNTPETVTPEETDADFYLSDANGNVLLELADGHIKTKEFDSSDINTETDTTLSVQGKPADAKAVGDAIDVLQEEIDNIEPSEKSDISATDQSTDADADLYISDTVGNGLVRVSNGHIQTKNFDSDNGWYKKVFAFTGPGNQTITRFFPAGTTLAFHLYDQTNKKTGAVASYKVTYTYTDKDNTAHTLGQEYGYNFPTYTLPEDAIAVSVIYGNIIIGGDHDLTFAVYSEGSFPRKPKIIKVAQDGSGDFTTLRGAVDSISDNNEYNPFEIWIYPGTYNVLEDYTDAEISASGFQGLFICDGVSLIGQGQRSEIIINGTLDTTKFDQSKRNDVSTLNITGTCRLENLTVNASYIRYAIHDDTGSPVHKRNSRTLKNLKVYGEHMTSGGYGQISYGAGGSNLKTVYAKDCDFSDCMGIHTDANAVHSLHVYLENCTARRFNFGDYDSGIPTYYFMRNCKAQAVYIGNNTAHAQYLMLDGEGTNDAMVICPTGYVYSIGDCRKFYNQSVTVGKAVKLTNNYGGISVATSLDSVYGISLGVKDSVTYVQVGGWLNATILGLTGLSIGDYLTIDSSGNVVSGGTAYNAIAQVKFVDDGGIIFARMMI